MKIIQKWIVQEMATFFIWGRELTEKVSLISQLQFEIDVRFNQQLNHIIRMSWNEGHPYFAYFYPYYDCQFPPQMQNPYFSFNTTFFGQNDIDSKECIQNIRGFDTEPQLSSQKLDSKSVPELKKNTMRKQKMLKKREREDNFERKKQKKDRNLPSNIFKYFISYLYAHPAFQDQLISPPLLRLAINPAHLISRIKGMIKQTQSYIRPVIIQQLCFDQLLNSQESLAFRILLKRFLLLDLPIIIGPMQKYKRRQRRELISLGRKLFQQIKMKEFQ